MHQLLAFLLGPLMRFWSSSVERTLSGVPRPHDMPQAHAAGVDADRILLVGSGPAVGWGVLSHDLALTGALARAISAYTGRGAVVDVIADSRLTAVSGLRVLEDAKLFRYDAILLIVGINDAITLTSPRVWKRAMGALLHFIENTSSQSTRIFAVQIPPIRALQVFDELGGSVAQWHARHLNKLTAGIVSELERTECIPFAPVPMPSGSRYRGPEEYRLWADLLADRIAVSLNSPGIELDPAQDARDLEAERQSAVDDLAIVDTPAEERFDRIVSLARRAFGTQSAALTVIDHDRQWNKSSVGTDIVELPRAESMCDVTIREPGMHVIGDTLGDARFGGLSDRVRFYAGFPVEAPSGERIGALCVFDPNPRDPGQVDEVLLRELAMLVQAELWRS